MYVHGNAATRSQYHRVKLYQILQSLGYYVVTFDYRGFADSSADVHPNEVTMTEDAKHVWEWIKAKCHPETKKVVVAHSLGTGVTSRFAAELVASGADKAERPAGYVLFAPFNKMLDEVMTFKAAKALSWTMDIAHALKEAKCEYDSETNIRSVQSEPIVIFHAEDDYTVPYELGVKLFEQAKAAGCDIELVSYEKREQIGHNNFVNDPDLRNKLYAFMEKL